MKTCSHCIMEDEDWKVDYVDPYGSVMKWCDYCKDYYVRANKELYPEIFGQALSKIFESSCGNAYDCLIGLSGGLDSSWVAYLLVKAGLKPFAITLDNGFDTDIAKHNVEALVKGLNLHHEVVKVNKVQYKDLQLSLLKASVKNAEAITDHVIITKMYEYANKLGLKYIVHGGNIVTEAIMPKEWGYTAMDWRQLKGIHKQFGTGSIKGFPHMNLWNWFNYTFLKRIKWFPLLNYYPYNVKLAKRVLKEELGWQDYGHKHMENIYTRFFQGYILPKKFGIDKRKAHLSTLICSGQMTRKHALELMQENYYSSDFIEGCRVRRFDKSVICKYFNLTEVQFDELIEQEGKSHTEYPNNEKLFKRLSGLVEFARKVAVSA